MLTRTSSQSLTEQLSARFAQRIRDRLLAPGARLPSVRQCAQQQGVSPSTVVAAYDQLLAQGLVEARKNRGFFVRESRSEPGRVTAERIAGSAPVAARTAATAATRSYAPIDATALIRGMFHKISNKPQPGMGVFPPEWLESTFMPAAVRKVTSTRALQEFSLQYGEPLGDSGLRRALSKKLASLVGACRAGEHHHHGRRDPCAGHRQPHPAAPGRPRDGRGAGLGGGVRAARRRWACACCRCRADPTGRDLDVMARYCEVHQPKLYVSVSVFHNPTGYCLSPGSAHRVLQLANQHDFHIVEDDTYSHIAPEHATRLCALDGLQRTIHVSGFAKILAPNWRVGFLAAPSVVDRTFARHQAARDADHARLAGKGAGLCIEQGQLRRHAERIKTRLDAARSRSVKLALNAGCTFRRRAGRAVRVGRHRRGHRRAGAAHARRRLSARARRAVPCAAQALHADAHQLRDDAGRGVLEEVFASWSARCERGQPAATASRPVRTGRQICTSSFSLALASGSLRASLNGAPGGARQSNWPSVQLDAVGALARWWRPPGAPPPGTTAALRISSATSLFLRCERRSRFIEPITASRPSMISGLGMQAGARAAALGAARRAPEPKPAVEPMPPDGAFLIGCASRTARRPARAGPCGSARSRRGRPGASLDASELVSTRMRTPLARMRANSCIIGCARHEVGRDDQDVLAGLADQLQEAVDHGVAGIHLVVARADLAGLVLQHQRRSPDQRNLAQVHRNGGPVRRPRSVSRWAGSLEVAVGAGTLVGRLGRCASTDRRSQARPALRSVFQILAETSDCTG